MITNTILGVPYYYYYYIYSIRYPQSPFLIVKAPTLQGLVWHPTALSYTQSTSSSNSVKLVCTHFDLQLWALTSDTHELEPNQRSLLKSSCNNLVIWVIPYFAGFGVHTSTLRQNSSHSCKMVGCAGGESRHTPSQSDAMFLCSMGFHGIQDFHFALV